MATSIFPSVADIGGAGKTIRETLLAGMLDPFGSWAVSGFTVTAEAGRSVRISPGTAMVAGRVIVTDADTVLSFGINLTRYIHLRMTLDASGNATAASLVASTSATPEAEGYVYLLLAVVTTTTADLATAGACKSWPKGSSFDLGQVALSSNQVLSLSSGTFSAPTSLRFPDVVYTAHPCRVYVLGSATIDPDPGLTPTMWAAAINDHITTTRYARGSASQTTEGTQRAALPVAGCYDLAAGARVRPGMAFSATVNGTYNLIGNGDTHMAAYMTRLG